eukprot:COSAG06_NODE_27551_length_591_cov_0.754065_1_plen_54_part_10
MTNVARVGVVAAASPAVISAAGAAALMSRGVVLLYACYFLGSVGGPRPAVQACA